MVKLGGRVDLEKPYVLFLLGIAIRMVCFFLLGIAIRMGFSFLDSSCTYVAVYVCVRM